MRLKIENQFKFLQKINFGIFKKIFFLLSLSYFCFYFIKNSSQISFDLNFEKNLANLLLSLFFCILSIYFNAYAWKNILRWFGQNNLKKNLVSFYVLTNILKYVPGGIWHFIERFNFIKNISNAQVAFYSTLIEPYFMLSASLLLTLIGIKFSPFFIFFIFPILFLNRRLIYHVLRRLESLKGKAFNFLRLENSTYQLKKRINLNSFFPAQAIVFEICFVVSKFIGFLFCLNMFSFDNSNNILLLAIFCLSWSIGLIVPTAPGGIGVFEACFLLFIGKSLPQNTIFVSLIYFRMVSTSADILLGLPFLFRKLVKRV